MKRRIVAAVMAFLLIMGCIGTQAKADAVDTAAMEEIILKVRDTLGIGDDFETFTYNYYGGDGEKEEWSFYWSGNEAEETYYVRTDGDAHIESFNKNEMKEKYSFPKYTPQQLKKYADKYLKQVYGEIADKVQPIEKLVEYNSMRSYIYRYERVENGIRMPSDYINIEVDYNTKELLSGNLEWHFDVEIPSAQGIMTSDAAKEIISKNVTMQLKYMVGSRYTFKEGDSSPEWETVVFLAYVPDKDYIAVDAKSGAIYENMSSYGYDDTAVEAAAMDEKSSSENGGTRAVISPAERKKLEEAETLISSDEAIKLVKENKNLAIDANMDRATAGLYCREDGTYYWLVDLQDTRPYDWENDDYYRAYASAAVDADNGKILSFSTSLDNKGGTALDNREAAFSKKQCKKIAVDFLKDNVSEKYAATKYDACTDDYLIGWNSSDEIVYAGYGYGFDRYVNDIQVAGDRIRVSVDKVTGKIYNFNVNWTEDVEFPSPKGIISAEQSFDAYMEFDDGYSLEYEYISEYIDGFVESVRLTYNTGIYPGLVDAFTAKQVNYLGEPVSEQRKSFTYKDIDGHKYEKEIRLLAGLGAGFAGDEFKPDAYITRSEFNALKEALSNMNMLGYNGFSIKGDTKLTRQYAAYAIAGFLGYSDIAGLDIYKLDYSDASKISKSCAGGVAICSGLGIMKAKKGTKFAPSQKITRGEAAKLLADVFRKAGM